MTQESNKNSLKTVETQQNRRNSASSMIGFLSKLKIYKNTSKVMPGGAPRSDDILPDESSHRSSVVESHRALVDANIGYSDMMMNE